MFVVSLVFATRCFQNDSKGSGVASVVIVVLAALFVLLLSVVAFVSGVGAAADDPGGLTGEEIQENAIRNIALITLVPIAIGLVGVYLGIRGARSRSDTAPVGLSNPLPPPSAGS